MASGRPARESRAPQSAITPETGTSAAGTSTAGARGAGKGSEPVGADAVDRLVADWHRERPDLPVEVMEVWSRLDRLARRLDRARARAFAASGLETWEFDVLAALRRSGAPHVLSPGRLLDELEVSSGAMTHRITRLVGRGLVWRRRDPDDGRGVLVGLTDEGRERVDDALARLLDLEGALLGALDPQGVDALGRGLRAVLAHQEAAEAAGSPAVAGAEGEAAPH